MRLIYLLKSTATELA